MLELFIEITFRWTWLILILGNGLAGYTILILDPAA